ncbi:hypothetical protein PENTCL1PPCAC_19616, partial [Pristionchus entomophagus]
SSEGQVQNVCCKPQQGHNSCCSANKKSSNLHECSRCTFSSSVVSNEHHEPCDATNRAYWGFPSIQPASVIYAFWACLLTRHSRDLSSEWRRDALSADST